MRILYGFSNCTDSTYNRIVSERNVSTMVPDQKYHGLLIKGLAQNGAEVRCFSGLPINRAVTSRKIVREKDEREGNAYYHYITSINLPVIRQLMVFFGTFFGVLKAKKDKDTYAICDFLNIAVALAFIFGCSIKGIKKIAIVTDLPNMFDSGRIRKKIGNFVSRHFDGYILLTEYMSKAINNDKPHIVLEGHVDSESVICDEQEKFELTIGKKVVIYAGNIQAKYGIKNLVEGFIKSSIPDAELWIYGDGDYKDELLTVAKDRSCVKYMGIISNEEIVDMEQKASLLVNPRPTSPEYTKYSFPSKNMEYMVSGTPTLTTKLPGMPEEYHQYVYLINEETPEGISKALGRVFSFSFEDREAKAYAARRFVLENKTNIIQASKIINFLGTELSV